MNTIAWQRIRQLFDPQSFAIMDDLEPSIHLLGKGRINGQRAYVCAGVPDGQRCDIRECFNRKIRWLETILDDPAPVVWLHDSPPQVPGGRTPIPARSDELLASNQGGVGRAFCLQARLNGRVVQFSALFGDAGASQTFAVRLADFTLLKRGSHLWIGRPDAVKFMLGAVPDAEQLGGAEMHCSRSGVGDVLFEHDHQAIEWIRRAAAMLPQRAGEPLPCRPAVNPAATAAEMAATLPADLNTPFDMHRIIDGLIDAGSWTGVGDQKAPEISTGWGRIDGVPFGIIANQSIHRGGILFPESCRKMNRFIRFCDPFRIPLLFLADNPGLMVGMATEQAGMLYEASDLLRTLAQLQTPRVCLVVRKAYTVGLYVMAGPGFDPSAVWATPQASIAVFGPKALDLFAGDRSMPEPALDAIRQMRHHATHPRDYQEKGFLQVAEWTDLRPRLETFAHENIQRQSPQQDCP